MLRAAFAQQRKSLTLPRSDCQAALYLGLDPFVHLEYMWLVDAALAPMLPVGWMRCSTCEGEEYYWNVLSGVAQWEHPHISIISGVVEHLRQSVVESTPRN